LRDFWEIKNQKHLILLLFCNILTLFLFYKDKFMAENFEGLKDLNKKYSQKRTSISILLTVLFVVLSVYIYACLLFYSVFYQVEVIGRSMQPTFNANLPADENEETTIYKDIAVVNRYETGTNGDVIIIHLTGSESDDGEEKGHHKSGSLRQKDKR
jgi:hypothetical protein